MSNQTIWIQDDTGVHALEPTLPNCWQGQANCIVGPFSSKLVAEYFARSSVDYGQYDAVMDSVFACRDAWYVEVKAISS